MPIDQTELTRFGSIHCTAELNLPNDIEPVIAEYLGPRFLYARQGGQPNNQLNLEMEHMCDRLVHAGGTLPTSELLFPGNLRNPGVENKILFALFQHGACHVSSRGLANAAGFQNDKSHAFVYALRNMLLDSTITQNFQAGRLYYSVHNTPFLLPLRGLRDAGVIVQDDNGVVTFHEDIVSLIGAVDN